MAIGGDHSITLPILRAIAARHGPVALVHVDAHADVNDEMFGERETHGTVFRRAYEEGLIEPGKTYQVGLRGTGYTAEDFTEARVGASSSFWRHELWHRVAGQRWARRSGATSAAAPDLCHLSTSTVSTPPMRPAPARRKSAG